MVIELGTEFLDGTLHRPHRRIPQGAYSTAKDVCAHVQEQVHVAGSSFTMFDAMC